MAQTITTKSVENEISFENIILDMLKLYCLVNIKYNPKQYGKRNLLRDKNEIRGTFWDKIPATRLYLLRCSNSINNAFKNDGDN